MAAMRDDLDALETAKRALRTANLKMRDDLASERAAHEQHLAQCTMVCMLWSLSIRMCVCVKVCSFFVDVRALRQLKNAR